MKDNVEEYLKLGISFLHGVDKLYTSSPAHLKKKIAGSIFPGNLVFLGKNYRTAKIDELVAAILSNHAGFGQLQIKTPRHFDGESNMAPLLGLPPRFTM